MTHRRRLLSVQLLILFVVVLFHHSSNNNCNNWNIDVAAAEEIIVDVIGDRRNTVAVEATTTNTTIDEPWEAITNFIRTNILFGVGSSSSSSSSGDHHSQTFSSGSISSSSSSSRSSKWDTFRASNVPKSEQPNDDNSIMTKWNDFLQSIGTIPNPFLLRENDKERTREKNEESLSSSPPNHLQNHRYDALTELIEAVSAHGHGHNKQQQQLSIPEMVDLFWNAMQRVHQQLEQTFKAILDLILPVMNPLKVYYYMLEQEIVHHPVHKRRQHAFATEVSLATAIQISEGLYVSQLAYAKDCTTIQQYLQSFHNNSWILINCTTTSRPFQPAHFLAIRRQSTTTTPNGKSSSSSSPSSWNYTMDRYKATMNEASPTSSSWTTILWDNLRDSLNMVNIDTTDKNHQTEELEAMLVICGTKDMADMMSDALLEPTLYGDVKNSTTNTTTHGLAHGGIYHSAMYIHTTYREFLETLVYQTNRSHIKLWLIGHSLGGGAAALASLEFNKPYNTSNNVSSNDKNNQSIAVPLIDAYALGFGTPAVLSKEHSEEARSRVTTIINDADCVPRMSGATLVNFLLNVTASNHWMDEARIDVQQLKVIMKQKTKLLPDDWIDTVMTKIYDWMTTSDMVNHTMRALLAEKVVTPVLYPPGECIHLYRDGTSWQGVYHPCHNFNAIEGVRYMVDDHLIPTGYYRGLLSYIRGLQNDMNWQFIPDLMEIPMQ